MKAVRTIGMMWAIFISFLIVCSPAWAGQFGAPQPIANENGFALGVGYFYSQNKMELSDNYVGDFKMVRNEIYIQVSGEILRLNRRIAIDTAILE